MKKLILGILLSLCITTPTLASSTLINRVNTQPYIQQIEIHEDRSDILCLALNIYHEARGSTRQDQTGVAWVTRNRVFSSNKTYCQIVWERGQFVWTRRSTNSLIPREMQAWHDSVILARSVIEGVVSDPTNGANSFYSGNRIPSWAANRPSIRIGAHNFVRVPGR